MNKAGVGTEGRACFPRPLHRLQEAGAGRTSISEREPDRLTNERREATQPTPPPRGIIQKAASPSSSLTVPDYHQTGVAAQLEIKLARLAGQHRGGGKYLLSRPGETPPPQRLPKRRPPRWVRKTPSQRGPHCLSLALRPNYSQLRVFLGEPPERRLRESLHGRKCGVQERQRKTCAH